MASKTWGHARATNNTQMIGKTEKQGSVYNMKLTISFSSIISNFAEKLKQREENIYNFCVGDMRQRMKTGISNLK